jgi:hypothetical protein
MEVCSWEGRFGLGMALAGDWMDVQIVVDIWRGLLNSRVVVLELTGVALSLRKSRLPRRHLYFSLRFLHSTKS